jgi:hypothetical protein
MVLAERLIRITTALAVVAVAVVAAVISYQRAMSWCAHTGDRSHGPIATGSDVATAPRLISLISGETH